MASKKRTAAGKGTRTTPPSSTRSARQEQGHESLLLVFIHGFKGSEQTTFAEFPTFVKDKVHASYPHLRVRPVIYPTYQTRGSLAKAVEAFVDWLTTTCIELECNGPARELASATVSPRMEGISGEAAPIEGGAGSVKVVLCGHSMGGLVAVDAALEIAKSCDGGSKNDGKLWPRVCGVIAFDTPYCGVHPHVFKNTANKYHGYLQSARTTAEQFSPVMAPIGTALASWWNRSSSSSEAANASGTSNRNGQAKGQEQPRSGSGLWSKALLATSAIALAGGAAAGTYYGGGWTYISDHFLFVSNLWDDQGQRARLDSLIELPQVFFHALYNRLPPLARSQVPRTFIVMPPVSSGSGKTAESFEAIDNSTATDEIDAHTTMFYASNAAYEQVGKRAAALIVRCLDDEARYGDQVHAQQLGDQEHGVSDEEAYSDHNGE